MDQSVKEYIAQKYGWSDNDEEMKAAKEREKKNKKLATYGQLASDLVTSKARSYDGSDNSTAFYDRMRDGADDDKNQLKDERRRMVRDWVTGREEDRKDLRSQREQKEWDELDATSGLEHEALTNALKERSVFKDSDFSNSSVKSLRSLADRFGIQPKTNTQQHGFIQDRDGNIFRTNKTTGDIELVREGSYRPKPPSATEAKKASAARVGTMAEDQYDTALEKGKLKNEYDPTSYADFIDNSSLAPNFLKNDAAIEAQAAANSWIDTFLRDESGAAIPDPERASYYKTYFPQMGDSQQTVENKKRLRTQKMEEAANAGMVDLEQKPETMMPQVGAPMVRIKAPDGRIMKIPAAKVKDAVAAGGQVIE